MKSKPHEFTGCSCQACAEWLYQAAQLCWRPGCGETRLEHRPSGNGCKEFKEGPQ